MKLLLAAINAKYIHSNPAVHSLKACAGEWESAVEIAEYTINQPVGQIRADIYRRHPDMIGFSCYIWNIGIVEALVRDLAAVLPQTDIWMGGPEVSYDVCARCRFAVSWREPVRIPFGVWRRRMRRGGRMNCRHAWRRSRFHFRRFRSGTGI